MQILMDGAIELFGFITFALLQILIAITAPIWIIPYLVWRHNKTGERLDT